MAEVPVSNRVDVIVSLGTQPISTVSFNSAAFLADLPFGSEFGEQIEVYESLQDVVQQGHSESTPFYQFAAKAFGGKFPTQRIFLSKYTGGGETPETPFDALTRLMAENDEAYYIGTDSRTQSDILAVASYCDSAKKMYVHSTQVAGVSVNATTTDIASVLQDAAYDHVLTLWSDTADANYDEGGVVGAFAGLQAGVSTLEDKTMTGVLASSLTATQRTALENKNVAYYMPIVGVNSVFNSKVASGQYFDTIVFSDWFNARLKEEIYGLIKRESDLGRKVAMDESGFAKIREACWRVINVGLANGSISQDVQPIVRTPERDEILDAQRAARELPNVVVEVLYSNAVHKVSVRAYVTI